MPDPNERHGKGDGWGSLPSRADLVRQAAMDSAPRRAPAKKDHSLCKDTHWKGPHTPEIRQSKGMRPECKWYSSYIEQGKPVWGCVHEEVCSGCGKILRIKVGNDECPDFRPITDEELEAIKKWADRVAGIRASRKPLIKGRQSYRKRRER